MSSSDGGTEKRLFFAPLPDLSVLSAFRAEFTLKQEIVGIQPPCCRFVLINSSQIGNYFIA